MSKASKNINCIIVDDEPIAREILEQHLSQISDISILGSCKNAIEGFRIINEESIDLVFLDINMPDITGLSFAKSLNKEIKIIFTTAYREYAVDGFDLQAVDYLLKPISYARLEQAVDKFRSEIRHETNKLNLQTQEKEKVIPSQNNYFFVRSDRKMVKVLFKDIQYIESVGDYLKIHCSNKSVICRETISNIESLLPKEAFIRIHRSYLVAIHAITSYTNDDIEINQIEIPISRSYKNAVIDRLGSCSLNKS